MTFSEREEIFSKEILNITDFEKITGMSRQASAKLIRQIRFKHDRLGIEGYVHIEDYFKYFDITDKSRYCKGETVENENHNLWI